MLKTQLLFFPNPYGRQPSKRFAHFKQNLKKKIITENVRKQRKALKEFDEMQMNILM